MMANPLLGVFFHWLGGLASASFYVPYRGVRGWSWEIFWLVGGVFSWLIAPWVFAGLRTHDLLAVLAAAPPRTLALCYLFGILWGFGGLTFGLTMRYLGISLGTAVALGLTATFGTLLPPLFSGQLVGTLIHSTGGLIVLAGVGTALVGIVIVGKAGNDKELEQVSAGEERADDLPRHEEFRKGMLVAVFSGVMSSCFAYGLAAGEPIRQLTLARGTDSLAQGLPVLVVVLLGGFTTNAVWCLFLILRNRSGRDRKSVV
jgi:L-rhamnose-H+ transport protein